MFKEPIREAEHMRGSGTVGAPVAHCRALCWGPELCDDDRCRCRYRVCIPPLTLR